MNNIVNKVNKVCILNSPFRYKVVKLLTKDTVNVKETSIILNECRVNTCQHLLKLKDYDLVTPTSHRGNDVFYKVNQVTDKILSLINDEEHFLHRSELINSNKHSLEIIRLLNNSPLTSSELVTKLKVKNLSFIYPTLKELITCNLIKYENKIYNLNKKEFVKFVKLLETI